jgi:hypothetical protein
MNDVSRTSNPSHENASHPKLCQLCEEGQKLTSFCVFCNASLCDDCWGTQIAHRRRKTGTDSDSRHEKADYDVVMRLKKIMEPSTEVETQLAMHRVDEDTTWFGVTRPRDNQEIAFFQDYGRYAAVMAETLSSRRGERFPQLVSFIGQTG